MENKVTEEELKTVIEQQGKLNKILNNVGYLEAQKHALLHEFGDINKEVEDYKTVLEEKYGRVNINLETGVYEDIVDEVEEVEENTLKSV